MIVAAIVIIIIFVVFFCSCSSLDFSSSVPRVHVYVSDEPCRGPDLCACVTQSQVTLEYNWCRIHDFNMDDGCVDVAV